MHPFRFLGFLLLPLALAGCFSGTTSIRKASYPDSGTSEYILPFEIDTPRTVIQGNSENPVKPWTHYGKMQFAYDFSMPIGTKILASRTGMVMFVRDDNSDDDHAQNQGNAIVILHEDGTAALYGHITRHGALVRPYKIVQQGTPIALSGNSGESPEPHLHFQVNETMDFEKSSSIPVSFKNAGTSGVMEKGVEYPLQP